MMFRTITSMAGRDKRACRLALAAAFSLLVTAAGCQQRGHAVPTLETPPDREEPPSAEIVVVYDNNEHDARLTTAWGFACVVTLDGRKILFDTGGDEKILLSNLRQLGIDAKAIDMVFLSHLHGDHVGGLRGFLRENPDVTVCAPASFGASFAEQVRGLGAALRQVSGPEQIMPDVYTTGELGPDVREQSLILSTEAGLVVVTGCAHPGVIRLLEQAKRAAPGEIALAIGGFHLSAKSRSEIDAIAAELQQLGVRFLGPCHCTGELARARLRQAWGSRYLPVGVGYRISSAELTS